MPDTPATGVYDALLTSRLLASVEGLRNIIENVDPAERAVVLGEYVGRQLALALRQVDPDEQVGRANALLQAIAADLLEPGPQQLKAVAHQEAPGVWRLLQTRPTVPLSRPALLTNAATDPKLGAELRAELATADRVDLLCAFVKWYGLRVLETELADLKARGIPMRVLTTTYMGATDRKALDRLVHDFGAEVRVNYETQSTRLHAKAWLFRRAIPQPPGPGQSCAHPDAGDAGQRLERPSAVPLPRTGQLRRAQGRAPHRDHLETPPPAERRRLPSCFADCMMS